MPTRGCAGASTRTATASPIRGTRRRDLLRGALPRRRRRHDRPLPRRLRLQPRRLVRERGAVARRPLRLRRHGVAFSLDRLQVSLDAARRGVVAANRDARRAPTTVAAARARVARAGRRAPTRATLLSDRLALEQRAGHGARRVRDAATARSRARQQTLATRAGALARAQQAPPLLVRPGRRRSSSARRPTRGGYVFPVGGGPASSPPRTPTTTIPAADIAAPLGSPLYALADAVVLRSWSAPDPRCGIGLTMQAFDGQAWTYCHLSVPRPDRRPGAPLSAGQPVGLVGTTGDATGPHLHLQLQPATVRWPQQEAWFQRFAGRAFRWSDAGAGRHRCPADERSGLRRRLRAGAAGERSRRPIHPVGG